MQGFHVPVGGGHLLKSKSAIPPSFESKSAIPLPDCLLDAGLLWE